MFIVNAISKMRQPANISLAVIYKHFIPTGFTMAQESCSKSENWTFVTQIRNRWTQLAKSVDDDTVFLIRREITSGTLSLLRSTPADPHPHPSRAQRNPDTTCAPWPHRPAMKPRERD